MVERDKRLQQLIDTALPMVEEQLGKEKSRIFESRAWQHYEPLQATAPSFAQRINAKLFVLGVPMLAVYRVFRSDFGMAQDPALRLLEDAVATWYRAMMKRPLARTAANVVFGLEFVRNSALKKAFAADEPHGFRFEKVDDPGAIMSFDVRECALVKYLKAQGAPEIVPIICRIDDLIAENLRGVTLQRTGTIGMGAERCDFRYVKK